MVLSSWPIATARVHPVHFDECRSARTKNWHCMSVYEVHRLYHYLVISPTFIVCWSTLTTNLMRFYLTLECQQCKLTQWSAAFLSVVTDLSTCDSMEIGIEQCLVMTCQHVVCVICLHNASNLLTSVFTVWLSEWFMWIIKSNQSNQIYLTTQKSKINKQMKMKK